VQIEVFDPAMCCSTGVCGPSVDPALSTFAADLDRLASSGVAVRRFNLGQEPVAFAQNDLVRELLTTGGEGALPIVMVEGAVQSSGRYPTLSELSAWAAVSMPTASSIEFVGDDSASDACCSPASSVDSESGSCCATTQPVSMGQRSSDATARC